MMPLLAVLLALAPEPKLSDADDFNEMVQKAEKEFKCEAVLLRKTPEDDARLVFFTCKSEPDFAAVFYLRPIGDWDVLPRKFRSNSGKVEGSAI